MTSIKFRKHIEEVIAITDKEFDYVSSFFMKKRLKKHQFLIQKGSPVNYEYWILKGLLKTYTIDENGKEYVLQFGMENYWTSDYLAFQNESLATLFIDCIEDSEFLCIGRDDKETICNEVPAMANFFRIKATKGGTSHQQRILSLLTETTEQRYNKLVAKLPHLMQRVPKKLIAQYLGVSRETLSRLNS